MSAQLLPVSLECGIRLKIAEIKRFGYLPMSVLSLATQASEDVCVHGDELLYRSNQSAELWGKLVLALVVAAFFPGGVTIFGCHWEEKFDED